MATALALGFASPLLAAQPEDAFETRPKTVLTNDDGFDRSTLMNPEYRGSSVSGFSLLNPNRFSMRQSYSVGFSSSSIGSQSSGLYLNTISYRLADPLVLSADVGFHMPFYSSLGGPTSGFQNPGLGGALVLPHVGLEYRPSENSSISIHFINGPDAAKAYGYPGNLFWHPWDR